MSSDAAKKRKQNREEQRRSPGTPSQFPEATRLRATMASGVWFQFCVPPGCPPLDPIWRTWFNLLEDAAKLQVIPADERKALIASAAKTFTKANYHEYRFYEHRMMLDKRRTEMPGEVFWDPLLKFIHFELQAFAGAARTLLDELVYIIARVNGANPEDARDDPWTTHTLVTFNALSASPKLTRFQTPSKTPEIALLRLRADWYETLNVFRNTFFHHGWNHGSGHFATGTTHGLAKNPERNGLLVPDRASVKGKKKPFEWTWNDGRTIDDVTREVREGLDGFVSDLFEKEWKVPYPLAGTMPRKHQPNSIITLAKPPLVSEGSTLFLCVFTQPALGAKLRPFATNPALELVEVPLSKSINDMGVFSVCLAGLASATLPSDATVDLVVNPAPDAAWKDVWNDARGSVPVSQLLEEKTHSPFNFCVSGAESIWVWAQRPGLSGAQVASRY